MTTRGSDALQYDAENRLTQVISGGVVTQYAYNADGARVKRAMGSATTYYIGNWFEVTQAGAVTKYYYFGARRVAMKQGSAVTYLHSDHLGSTSVASNASGALVARQTYYPYGAPRTSEGALPTDYTFTGQKNDASSGLMFYNARYYDAALGRFTQPDLLIPNLYNPQALNRYAYVLNNPVRYTDPSGHASCGTGSGLQWEDCPVPDDGGARTGGRWLPMPSGSTVKEQEERLITLSRIGRDFRGSGMSTGRILVELTRIAAELVNDDPARFVDDMTRVLLGWSSRDAAGCGIAGAEGCRDRRYSRNLLDALSDGGSGFPPELQDPPGTPRSSQPAHFWEYVAIAFETDRSLALTGNFIHELWGAGASTNDLVLGRLGVDLGSLLQQGEIRPSQVPQWLRERLLIGW